MKTKVLIIFFALLWWLSPDVNGQDTITLEWCVKTSQEVYPLIRQKGLLNDANLLKINNLKASNLPQFSINGQASYQSDVTSIPIKLPFVSIPEQEKDMYKLTLDVNQVIYDAGTTKTLKELENEQGIIDQQSLEVEMYKLKDRISQIYFSILLNQAAENILKVLRSDLEQKREVVLSGFHNGTMMESGVDQVDVEILKADQQIVEAEAQVKSGKAMLELFLNQRLKDGMVLAVPSSEIKTEAILQDRIESRLFESQINKMKTSESLSQLKVMPKLFAFGQAGYGRPGLNMLDNDFAGFYMVGAKLTWAPWNWNVSQREKKIYQLQRSLIQVQKETFDKNLAISVEKCKEDISKNLLLYSKDEEIIKLRERIVRSASSQLENGILLPTDYLREKNLETQAKINLEIHKIMLAKSLVDYQITIGKF